MGVNTLKTQIKQAENLQDKTTYELMTNQKKQTKRIKTKKCKLNKEMNEMWRFI